MVHITNNRLHIEIETTSPHEELHLLSKDLLQLLLDSNECYLQHDPKLSVYQLLHQMVPDISQLEKGV
jgi:hypothetical protein